MEYCSKPCLPRLTTSAVCLLLLIPACRDDLCKSQPPALEVTITLGNKIKAKTIKTLHIDLTGTFNRSWSFKITDELSDDKTSFAVALGPAGEGGFIATVLVRAVNEKGQQVARGEKTFPNGSGDACNFFVLELGVPAPGDGGTEDAGDLGVDAGDSGLDISDTGTDRSPDQQKPDTTPLDTTPPDTTPPDTTPPDLCPSGDFSGSKKTCTKATDCDDKLACTVDVCSGCVCYNVVKVGRCMIGGACYKAGAADLKDTCKRCTPTTSATTWTFSTAPGCVTTLAGDGINGYVNGAAASARFYEPYGVAVDGKGWIYVSDYYNQKLRYILGGKVYPRASIVTPGGVSVDISGKVYVANALQHVVERVINGLMVKPVGTKMAAGYVNGLSAKFDRPVDVAVNSKGMVFVADHNNHVIRKIDTNNKNDVSLFAGTKGKSGHSDKSGSILFNHPNGVAVDNKGSVFVADRSNHVIRRIWIKDGKVNTIAGTPNKQGTASSSYLDKPISVAVNNTGRVYLSDSGNNVIRQLQLDYYKGTVGSVTNLAGKGTAGFADGEALKTAMFHNPHGLAVDAFGMVHVADRLNHKVRTVHTVGYWVPIKAGKFTMGSPELPTPEPCRDSDETEHPVTLSNDFEIMTTEVTQDQFHTSMGYNPSYFPTCGGTCPVENVSWHEAVAYCNALSKKVGKVQCYSCSGSGSKVICKETVATSGTGIYDCPGYRLPTEAEWEFAYRATTKTAYYSGKNDGKKCNASHYQVKDPNADKIGFLGTNSSVTYAGCHKPACSGCLTCIGPHPVGSKLANLWGLYDMAGNVSEWCHDQYQQILGAATDPVGVGTKGRVFRGGAYFLFPKHLRAADRNFAKADWRHNDLGFRCARSIP